MKLYSPDGSELMEIKSLQSENGQLVMKGTAFGAMPIVAILRPEEMRAGVRLINLRTFFGAIVTFFRRKKG